MLSTIIFAILVVGTWIMARDRGCGIFLSIVCVFFAPISTIILFFVTKKS